MLRLDIDGQWEPQDFIEVLTAIESMYYKMTIRHIYELEPSIWLDEYPYFGREWVDTSPLTYRLDRLNARLLERARYITPSERRLSVRRIQYASPGGIDLLGIGKAVEAIAKAIGSIVIYYNETNIRRERDTQASLETEKKRISVEKDRENLQTLKIKNAERMIKLIKKNPEMHDSLISSLVRDQDMIASRIAEHKLISAQAVPSDQDPR